MAELDRHIVGQGDAKRAVAIAMRNRWRRRQLPEELRREVTPRNVLLVGPTGCGKTEVARRMAQLSDAPFLKVEGTYAPYVSSQRCSGVEGGESTKPRRILVGIPLRFNVFLLV